LAETTAPAIALGPSVTKPVTISRPGHRSRPLLNGHPVAESVMAGINSVLYLRRCPLHPPSYYLFFRYDKFKSTHRARTLSWVLTLVPLLPLPVSPISLRTPQAFPTERSTFTTVTNFRGTKRSAADFCWPTGPCQLDTPDAYGNQIFTRT